MTSLIAAALISMSGAGQATTFDLVYSENFAFPLSPNQQNLAFPQFDTLGGTRVLKQVVLDFAATVGAGATAENDSSLAAPSFQLNLSGFITVDGPDLSGFAGINEIRSQALTPTDGVTGSGSDFHNFGFVSDNVLGSDSTAMLAPYIGLGNVNFLVAGSAGFSFSGTTDATLGIIDLGASGKVTLTYKYDLIPTPGAASLFAVAGLVGIRRRRSN